MMMSPALYKTNMLSWIFFSASSLKQQSADKDVARYPHSETTNLCSFSLMMRA
jgi:hypothetical protein